MNIPELNQTMWVRCPRCKLPTMYLIASTGKGKWYRCHCGSSRYIPKTEKPTQRKTTQKPAA